MLVALNIVGNGFVRVVAVPYIGKCLYTKLSNVNKYISVLLLRLTFVTS